MKKFFVAILAILYLSTSIGATIHLHYCMGKLVEWGLWDKNGSICSNCGMEREPGSNNKCCKDESKRIKIDKDQKLSESRIHLNEIITGTTLIDFPNYSTSFPLFSPGRLAKINGPPLCRNTSLNIFNCVSRV